MKHLLVPPMLYISTSVWVLRTPNAGRNSHFQHFSAKSLKKQDICSKFLQKTCFFKFSTKRWSTGISAYYTINLDIFGHLVFFLYGHMVKNIEQKRLKTAEKKCFNQLLGARSTRKLVEIHNIHVL